MSDACSPDPRFDAATMAVDARPGLAFAGSGLDRAAYLRGDAAALERMAADPAARILPFWRGRPLLAGEEAAADPVLGAGLAGLAPGAELLSHMTGGLIFLGLSGGAPVFAADLSPWVPEGPEPDFGAFFDGSAQHHPGLPAGAAFADLRGAMMRLDPRAAELAATARALLNWHGTHGFCSACGAASAPALGGWQRVCPACNTIHYENPLNVVGTLPVLHDGRVLLCKRNIQPRLGKWTLPAGFMELAETTAAGARRETDEEAGADIEMGRLFSVINVPQVGQVHFFYLAQLKSEHFYPGPETMEARLFTEAEIPWDEIAFRTVKLTLEHFFADRRAAQLDEPKVHCLDLL